MLKNIKDCVDGDTFIHNGYIITIADSRATPCSDTKVCAFSTRPWFYIYPQENYVYGYTNGGMEVFDKDSQVEVIHNLLEIGKEKRNEIHRKELIECGIL